MEVKSAITSRDGLVAALHRAASLEHGVVCRYLYAGFSLKNRMQEGGLAPGQMEAVRSWQTAIYRVAREEMEHMGLVYNLLTAIGAAPTLERPFERGAAGGYHPALHRFRETSIREFARIEAEHETPPDDEIESSDTIGALYAGIRAGFETVARKNAFLFVGPTEAQVANQTLDLPPGWYDFDLHSVVDLKSALRAIDLILEESRSVSADDAPGHADLFYDILNELATLTAADPTFEPARPVASDPTLAHDPSDRGASEIRHPITRRAAGLFNASYETMLLMLGRFYSSEHDEPRERWALRKSLFFPLMTTIIRPLGEMLTSMPMSEPHDGETAGPTFEVDGHLSLRPDTMSAWTLLLERLQDHSAGALELRNEIERSDEPWTERIAPRMRFLQENLSRLAINFEADVDLRRTQTHFLFKRTL